MAVAPNLSSASISSWNLSDLGIFYVKHKSEFTSYAMRFLSDRGRAEEVVHDALLKFILASPELNSENHARGYVYRTIENLCIDVYRVEGRRPTLVLLDDAKLEIEESALRLNSDSTDSLVEAEDAAIVRQALALLSPAERGALVLWEIEGRSKGEIARELGIKESAVRHTVSRARSSLRKILSSLIIDEARGLTGLDLLSRTYGRATAVAKKSSKVALALLLCVLAFTGFDSRDSGVVLDYSSNIEQNNPSGYLPYSNEIPTTVPKSHVARPTKSSSASEKKEVSKSELSFPGLSKSGLPIGFTVADSSGRLGAAYFREKTFSLPNSYASTSQIIKTESIAANVFMTQKLTVEEGVVDFSQALSYGRSGEWVPLLSSVSKSEFKRLSNGNYLLTAYIAVQSEVEPLIRVVSKAGGRDLEVAPSRVITRLVLDPSKSMVLSQAVYVIENEVGA